MEHLAKLWHCFAKTLTVANWKQTSVCFRGWNVLFHTLNWLLSCKWVFLITIDIPNYQCRIWRAACTTKSSSSMFRRWEIFPFNPCGGGDGWAVWPPRSIGRGTGLLAAPDGKKLQLVNDQFYYQLVLVPGRIKLFVGGMENSWCFSFGSSGWWYRLEWINLKRGGAGVTSVEEADWRHRISKSSVREDAGISGRCSLGWDLSDPSSSWVTVVAGYCDLLRNPPIHA